MAFSNVIREMLIDIKFRVNSAPMKEMENRVSNMKRNMSSLGGGSMSNIQRSMNGLITSTRRVALGFAGMTAGAGFFLNEAGQFNKTRIAFETMTGSVETGRKLLEELHVFATETPFTLKDVEQNSAMLIGMGIETEKIIPTMKALGDVAAGINRPLGMVALNFGQIKTRGVLMGTELRDFARQGVPIIEQLAKTLGKELGQDLTGKDVQEMTSKRLITFEHVEQAFKDMTQEGGRFNDLMFKQAKTWPVMISNFLIQLKMLSRGIGQELLPQAKKFLSLFMTWIKANKKMLQSRLVKFFKAWFKILKAIWKFFIDITPRIKSVVKALGGLEKVLIGIGLVLLAIVGIQLAGMIGNLVIGMGTLIAAIFTANVAMGFMPVLIGIVIILIALLAQDIYGFLQGQDSLMGRIINRWTKWQKVISDIAGLFGKISGWDARIRFLTGMSVGENVAVKLGEKRSTFVPDPTPKLNFKHKTSVPDSAPKGTVPPTAGMTNTNSNVTVNQTNEITINESESPIDTATAVGEKLDSLQIMNNTSSSNAVSVKGL